MSNKIGISININVTKILKDRLISGEKGTYLDLTTFIDIGNPDKYGNHGFVSQSQTKEERSQGAALTPILGNSRVFYQESSPAQTAEQSPAPDFDDDMPF